MKRVEFLFDFGSPTTYLAWTQLPTIAERQGATIEYTPILLGAVHKATGAVSPINVPAKGKWMMADLSRFARRYGVPMRFNPHFPLNTLQSMRAATALLGTPQFEPYMAAMFNAMWVEAANLNEPEVVAEILRSAGLDPAEILVMSSRQDTKDKLRQSTEAAVARGVFGAPTFFVADEMHFGQDRLDFVEALLAGNQA